MRLSFIGLTALIAAIATPAGAQVYMPPLPDDAPAAVRAIAKDLCATPAKPDSKRELEASTCVDCEAKAALPKLSSELTAHLAIARDLAALDYIDINEMIPSVYAKDTVSVSSLRREISGKIEAIPHYKKTLAIIENRIAKSKQASEIFGRLQNATATTADLQFLEPFIARLETKVSREVETGEIRLAGVQKEIAALEKRLESKTLTENSDKTDERTKLRKTLAFYVSRVPELSEYLQEQKTRESQLQRWKNAPTSAEASQQWITDALKQSVFESYKINPYELAQSKKYLKEAEEKLAELRAQLADLESQGAAKGNDPSAKLARLEERYKKVVESSQTCGLTIGEAAALLSYTQSGYRKINYLLRVQGDELEEAKPYMAAIEAALKKIKPYQGMVTRGVELPDDRLAQHKVGAVLTYPGFTSTSAGGKAFDIKKHQFVIQSKTGNFIGFQSQYLDEYEVLFRPGTKFKVISREGVLGGYFKFVMEEVD
jgi:hypothetical protein